MGRLPSGYIPLNCIGGSNCYFDTGVTPNNTTNITGLFMGSLNATATYVFGSRNQSQTTSSGQFNLLIGTTTYLGYNGGRTAVVNGNLGYAFNISNVRNQFIINYLNSQVYEIERTSGTFSGTRSMFLLALNNAGSVSYGSSGTTYPSYMMAFKLEDENIKREYCPVYKTASQEFGLYEFEQGQFLSNQGTGSLASSFLLEVQTNGNGVAYIETANAGNVTKEYLRQGGNEYIYPRLKAVADEGYVFLNWTDENDNVLSMDDDFLYEYPSTVVPNDVTITANFVHKTQFNADNSYMALGLKYGVGYIQSSSDPDGRDSDIYALVKKFTIKEDGLSKSVSQIVLNEVPDAYQIDMPIALYDPKGKIIYCGKIESIDDKTLNCREPASIFDGDYVFKAMANSDSSVIGYAASISQDYFRYGADSSGISNIENNIATIKKGRAFGGALVRDSVVFFDPSKNVNFNIPNIDDTSVGNLEDYYIDLFNQFGVTIKGSIIDTVNSAYPQKGIKHIMRLYAFNPLKYDSLVIGDNVECIRDIVVNVETQETTVIAIYNSTATSFKGVYGLQNDGTIAELPYTMSSALDDFICSNECKNKVILSDDKLNTLLGQNLSSAMYNHKITFTVDLGNSLYRAGDFEIGRRVKFYYKDKVYNSIITAKEYEVAENQKQVQSMKITLGNVRTKLTTKLNLSNTKKKK